MTGSCLCTVWQKRPRLSRDLFILNLCGGACGYKEGTSAFSCVSGSAALSVTTYWDTPAEWLWWASVTLWRNNKLVLWYRSVPWERFSDLLASVRHIQSTWGQWNSGCWNPPSVVCVFGGGWFGLTAPWSHESPGRNLPMANFKYGPGACPPVEIRPKGICFTCFKM